ncbi:hypothetical protein GKQ38_03015 [Candidatus Nanohaloarchaea archaeon]|nr:hypothetical protein GKQ38_03015 [Candidatus Nanohaloarchaea archaeon]
MLTKRKGITPVIAIVLLLLITVGAVGVVYTQFQSLIGNPGQQVNQQQQIRNTDMNMESLYKTSGSPAYVNITLSNVGSVAWNSTEFSMSYVPQGTGSAVSGRALASTPFTFSDTAKNCFEQSNYKLVNPGEKYTCNTGIEWPSAANSIGISVSMDGAAKSFGPWTCDPQTSSSVGC